MKREQRTIDNTDWDNWDEVSEYLDDNGKDLPDEIWESFVDKKKDDNYDYIYLKEKNFSDPIISSKGVEVGKKILHNALRKYFCMINKMILLKHDQFNMFIYNGKHYESRSIKEVDKFLYDNVLPYDNQEGLKPLDYNTFRVNLLAQKREDKNFLINKTMGYLNFKNCILDVNTLETMDHTPDLFFTYMINYDYTTSSEMTPVWDKLLGIICCNDPELMDTILFYMGYMFSMDTTKQFQFFLMMVGKGENGKTYFVNAIKKLLSPPLYTTEKIGKMSDNRFSASNLENKIAILTDDEKKDVFKNPDFIKELVGGNETMSLEKKFQDSYEINIYAKPIITSNYLPFLSDTSYGFQRRFLIIPLNADTKKMERSELINDINHDTFMPENPAMIRKCLKRYRLAQQEGFTACEATRDLQKRLVRFSSQLPAWLDEQLIYTGNPLHRVPIKILYDLYDYSVESGKINNKKKYGNFKIEMEKWLDDYRNQYHKENQLEICKAVIRKGLVACNFYFDRERETLVVLDDRKKPDFLNYGNISNGRYRYVLEGFVTSISAKDPGSHIDMAEEVTFG